MVGTNYFRPNILKPLVGKSWIGKRKALMMKDYKITGYVCDYPTVPTAVIKEATAQEAARKLCRELKEAYGLDNLEFFMKFNKFHCRYVSNSCIISDKIDPSDLDYILKALSMQQGNIIFEDTGDTCVGMDELKSKYLIFRLAGI